MSALAVFEPLVMTSLAIAEATGRKHKNVLRDAKAMIIGLYGEQIVDRMIPEDRKYQRAEFVREASDALISELCGDGSNWSHPSGGVSLTRDVRGYVSLMTFDQSHAYTLAAGYDVVLRKRIIDRWLELEAERRQPSPDARIAALEARVAALEAKPAIPAPRRAKPDVAERIAVFLRKRGSATRSEILREFRDMSAAELNTVLDRLGVAGQVVVALVKQHAKKCGPPAEVCRWMQ